jgi:hypothetical protein
LRKGVTRRHGLIAQIQLRTLGLAGRTQNIIAFEAFKRERMHRRAETGRAGPMSIEIDILNGDASWPIAEPLFKAVYPRDVVEKLPWGHIK